MSITAADIPGLLQNLEEALTHLVWAHELPPPWASEDQGVLCRMYRGSPATDKVDSWVVHATAYRCSDGAFGYAGTAVRGSIIMRMPDDLAEVAYKLADVLVRARDTAN